MWEEYENAEFWDETKFETRFYDVLWETVFRLGTTQDRCSSSFPPPF